ncbi:MAG: hypothetical protein WC456_01265 [Patescibacteria group bacterium]
MPGNQIIKLKKTDLDQALVRGLGRAAWEAKKTRAVREQIHILPKHKRPRHKPSFIAPE